MERALDPRLLAAALGAQEGLPTVEELSQLIGEAEIALLLTRGRPTDELRKPAWYLHTIASTREALDLYPVERRRAAFQVSAHILDVILQAEPDLPLRDKLEYAFATQIAFMRSSFEPNALAVYSRELAGRLPHLRFVQDWPLSSLAIGNAILSVDATYLFPTTRDLRTEIRELEAAFASELLGDSPLAAAAAVAISVRELLVFLVYGRGDRLDRARELLSQAITNPASTEDEVSRWVAAHLLEWADGLASSSVWTALPPEVPSGVRRAFASGWPRVSVLWPPQLDVLAAPEDNPLSADIPRMVVSMPTSAGKTLVAQVIIATHLASGSGGVCYVAPTRSLGNEVRRSLDERLRYLDYSVAFEVGDLLDNTLNFDLTPDVEVMTPERLAFMVRNDLDEVLRRFTLFVFDEAHNVADETRGWTLEALISHLHHSTLSTEHSIVLMSAALGNRNHFIQWLTNRSGPAVERHSDWRGPRRLHCIWTTEPKWDERSVETRRSAAWPIRETYPLFGRLYARTTRDGSLHVLETQESIGMLALSVRHDGREKRKEDAKSTRFYKMTVPLVEFLEEKGPVLVIESTRPQTIRTAQAIAAERPISETPGVRQLQQMVALRLGEAHPLVAVLEKGVGYHHGAVPLDIRASVEDAVRDGLISVVVATTSLTEGVNLPVRSVIVASQGTWGPEGPQEFITGSKLINAIGRAGRAAKETEGIVVLCRQERVSPAAFQRLDPPPQTLEAHSILAAEDALVQLAAFEEALRSSEDAVFEEADPRVLDFVSYVWFLAAELERLGQVRDWESIVHALGSTLVWQQTNEAARERMRQVAAGILRKYESTSTTRRMRWAKSGAALPAAALLERTADEVASIEFEEDELESPAAVIRRLLEAGRLQSLLQISGAPRTNIFDRRGGSRRTIEVDLLALLGSWLSGVEVGDLGNEFLAAVPDVEYRTEQLGDLIGSFFEVFLPWALSVLIAWANPERESRGLLQLPSDLPAYVRWGVHRPECLQLLGRGVWSRRLAHAAVRAWEARDVEEDVFSWVAGLQVQDWRSEFRATPAELSNLLDCLRPRGGGVASKVLSGEVVEIPLDEEPSFIEAEAVDIRPIDEEEPADIGVWLEQTLLGRLPNRHRQDVVGVLSTGLAFNARTLLREGEPTLSIQLAEEPE